MPDAASAVESEVATVAGGPDLTQRTIHAAKWRSASYLVQGAFQFGLGVVLARLLPPEDFGLAALAMVVVGFVALLAEVGLSSAVVYHRPLTERHIRVSFTASIIVACAFAAALFLLAPYAAGPFRNQSLPSVLRVEALLFLLTGPGITALALLRRALDFRKLFLIDVGSYLLGYGLVAVSLALSGWGVWSLVFGVLIRAGVATGLGLILVRHPLRPLLAVEQARQLLTYGAAATINSVISYTAHNADSFVVGRWLGASALGFYARALNVIWVPIWYLTNTTSGVLFPAMSEIRTDVARFRTAYLFGVQITTLIAAPLCAGVVVAAPHLIVGLYGKGWSGAILPLQILAGAGLFRAVARLGGAVSYASGNVMAEVRRQVVFTLVITAGGIFGASWGIWGVSLGVATATVLMYFAMTHLSLRIVQGRWREFFGAQLPGLMLGLEVAILAAVIRRALENQEWASIWVLVAIIIACAAWLPVGTFLLPRALRPKALFSRFVTPISRLPWAVRGPLMFILRLHTDTAISP